MPEQRKTDKSTVLVLSLLIARSDYDYVGYFESL